MKGKRTFLHIKSSICTVPIYALLLKKSFGSHRVTKFTKDFFSEHIDIYIHR